jgi:S-DNA-T family DNA segregation ATPase FtsK/SpoIIIE
LITQEADLAPALQAVASTDGPHLVLVDDAAGVDAAALAELLDERRPDVHVVAADQSDVLRTAYGHWTQVVRRSRLGLLLGPPGHGDGDLWQVTLPRVQVGPLPGRALLVAPEGIELVQAALP